jgi:hypothetical protein
MSDCNLLATCIFFNDKMAAMPGMAELYKTSYCRDDNSKCARFRVFSALGREKVPADLYPNDLDVANQIING